MKFKVQVVTLLDDGEESLREVACVERDDLSAVSLGLSIADSKAIVQGALITAPATLDPFDPSTLHVAAD